MTIHATFGLSPSDCPGCGCNISTCPCDKTAINNTLTVTVVSFTGTGGYTCPSMAGTTYTVHHTLVGDPWLQNSFSGACAPFSTSFDCTDGNFTITIVFAADLTASGTVSTAVQCTPTLEVDFTLTLVWSGFNGTTTCCGFSPDTFTATTVGTILVKVTG